MKKLSWPWTGSTEKEMGAIPFDPPPEGPQPGYGTMNPSISTMPEENPPDGSEYSGSMLSPLDPEEFPEIVEVDEELDGDQLDRLLRRILNLIGRKSTIISWGAESEDEIIKANKSGECNLICLDSNPGTKTHLNSFATKNSSPMFYKASARADGFFGRRPFTTNEEAEISIKNISANLKPISYAVFSAESCIDMRSALKKEGFELIQVISGSFDKYIVKKNDLKNTAIVKHYNVVDNCISSFRCDIADSYEDKASGLQSYSGLGDNCGLLFRYGSPRDLTFHMGSVKFPIDIAFIDEDDTVKKIYSNVSPGSLGVFSCGGAQTVIEVSANALSHIGVEVGDKLFIEYGADSEALLKESRLLNSLGISKFIVKQSNSSHTSLERFEKFSILNRNSNLSTSDLVKTASIDNMSRDITIFNLNDFISDEKIKLYRNSDQESGAPGLSLFSKTFYSSGDYITASFRQIATGDFYNNISNKYSINISDIIYAVNNSSEDLLRKVYGSCSDSNSDIAFVYSGGYNPEILLEAVELSVNSRFDKVANFSGSDRFRVPDLYESDEILLASKQRFFGVNSSLVTSSLRKNSGIPVPNSVKSDAKRAMKHIDRAKNHCNKLIENINKNSIVYTKLKDKPGVIKSSAGEYSESSKRNARICKKILLEMKSSIELLGLIKDVSTTEEAMGSLADTSKTFSSSMKDIFNLINIIDTDEFTDALSQATNRGAGAIDDLKITIDRVKNYIARDILGIIIISE